jgi:hypothetical protein
MLVVPLGVRSLWTIDFKFNSLFPNTASLTSIMEFNMTSVVINDKVTSEKLMNSKDFSPKGRLNWPKINNNK